jgi:hypothetical protein
MAYGTVLNWPDFVHFTIAFLPHSPHTLWIRSPDRSTWSVDTRALAMDGCLLVCGVIRDPNRVGLPLSPNRHGVETGA